MDSVRFARQFSAPVEVVESVRNAPLVEPDSTRESGEQVRARSADFVNAEKDRHVDELLIGRHPGESAEELRGVAVKPREAIAIDHADLLVPLHQEHVVWPR